MIPPASCRREARPIHKNTPIKNKKGKNDNKTTRTLDEDPTPVTVTPCLFSVGANEVSLMATGIWLV